MRASFVCLFVFVSNAADTGKSSTSAVAEASSRHIEDELEALDALVRGPRADGGWRRLRDLYRECPGCCENSADEGFGWIPATLLAKHWTLIEELGALAVKDPAWIDFVMRSLHGPIDPKLLRQAAGNAKTCPKAHRRLCERIRVNALEAAQEVDAEKGR